MSKQNLEIGDTVLWAGAWGSEEAKETTVTAIEKDCIGKYGTKADSVEWSKCDGRSVIVTLSNGHWAYGSQLTAA